MFETHANKLHFSRRTLDTVYANECSMFDAHDTPVLGVKKEYTLYIEKDARATVTLTLHVQYIYCSRWHPT